MAIPASSKTATLADVEHVVCLMQENRSFDHYLGTLNGVRGFYDPRAVRLQNGNPVFEQPAGAAAAPSPYVLPYHPTAANLGLQFLEDLQHDWDTTHVAWNNGRWDQCVPAKSPLTMVYLTRDDIPYHCALADAFTVCDANRYRWLWLARTAKTFMHQEIEMVQVEGPALLAFDDAFDRVLTGWAEAPQGAFEDRLSASETGVARKDSA